MREFLRDRVSLSTPLQRLGLLAMLGMGGVSLGVMAIGMAGPDRWPGFWPISTGLAALTLGGLFSQRVWILIVAGFGLGLRAGGMEWPVALLFGAASLMAGHVLWLTLRGRMPLGLNRWGDLGALALAAALAGLAGGLVVSFGLLLIKGLPVRSSFPLWAVTEAVNVLALMPALSQAGRLRASWRRGRSGFRRADVVPLVLLVLAMGLGILLPNLGTMHLAVLGLLWCALCYPLLPMTVILAGFGAYSWLVIPPPLWTAEVRWGLSLHGASGLVMLMALGVVILRPKRLGSLVEHLGLERHGALAARVAFRTEALRILEAGLYPVAFLKIAADDLTYIERLHGAAALEAVHLELGRRAAACLRSKDAIGRLGQGDYGVFLGQCPPFNAEGVANRILDFVTREPMVLPSGQRVAVALHIVGITATGEGPLLEDMMELVEEAMARARLSGGEQIVMISWEELWHGPPK